MNYAEQELNIVATAFVLWKDKIINHKFYSAYSAYDINENYKPISIDSLLVLAAEVLSESL